MGRKRFCRHGRALLYSLCDAYSAQMPLLLFWKYSFFFFHIGVFLFFLCVCAASSSTGPSIWPFLQLLQTQRLRYYYCTREGLRYGPVRLLLRQILVYEIGCPRVFGSVRFFYFSFFSPFFSPLLPLHISFLIFSLFIFVFFIAFPAQHITVHNRQSCGIYPVHLFGLICYLIVQYTTCRRISRDRLK